MYLSLIALVAWAPWPCHSGASFERVGCAEVVTVDSPPAWFRRHLEGLARGTGRWTADNSAFKSEGEPWEAYGMEWTWGLARQTVKGRLYAIKDGKEVGSLFEYRVLWHPGDRKAMIFQYGSDGTYGWGVIEPDGENGTVVEQTFFGPDGGTTRVKHTDVLTGDSRVAQSFDWTDGTWKPRRLYRFKLAT